MPKVSVIIPTHNRPELLKKAIESVLAQTYSDFEVVVVDDGLQKRSNGIVEQFHDRRIRYLQHDAERGGSAARNSGIRAATGDFIAFLDDDDEWLPEKLDIQMARFAPTDPDVGFCFSAVTNIYHDHEEHTVVLDGIRDHFSRALGNPKGYLTVTLIVKRKVFDTVGLFDEALPSHQETDLIIRAAKYFKGLGINQSLVRVNMQSGYDRTGGSIERRIAGREMIIRKNLHDLRRHREKLAWHYFQLGLWYRSLKDYRTARKYFWMAFKAKPSVRLIAHTVSMLFSGVGYRILS